MQRKPKNIAVIVLGDIGRSPRMQYHSLSLAEHGHKVDIIGYKETKPLSKLEAEPLVFLHYLVPYPSIPFPRIFNYVLKTIWQFVTLAFAFLIIRKPDYILVQNPPAVPALVVCWLFSLIFRAKLIIDWHNYAFSIMSLSVGSDHPLVRLTRRIETFCGRRAAANFCVTEAMKNDLFVSSEIKAVTLYDRPPEVFRPITLKEKHDFFNVVSEKYGNFSSDINFATAFTSIDEAGNVLLKADRPALLISSTSWTEDEDFSVLLNALEDYEAHSENENLRLPKLVCVITGKGPLKNYYSTLIASKHFQKVNVVMPWLDFQDYPLMLASSDLGVCLHKSSSGFDLPMKVVDMFGCGLPVCAIEFSCINELVVHEKNSFTFKSQEELSEILVKWFRDFPNNKDQKELEGKFKSELQSFQKLRWRENWDQVAYPVFE